MQAAAGTPKSQLSLPRPVWFRVAACVRWLALFCASGLVWICLFTPIHTPFGLILAQLRLAPATLLAPLATIGPAALALLLIAWVLNRRDMCSPSRPIAWSAALVLAVTVALAFPTNGEDGRRGLELAMQQTGPGYGQHVESVGYSETTTVIGDRSGPLSSTTERFRTATVVVWNAHEIRTIRVKWPQN